MSAEGKLEREERERWWIWVTVLVSQMACC